jgi:NADPH:quinone reductase-like Zn-dependent oxidoreductase
MQIIVCDNYGSPDVLKLETQDRPTIGAQELLVEVHATSVTTADWRFRAAWFPAGMGLLGRLMLGLRRPRNRSTGREFSGRIVAVGAEVTRFQIGDEVFGSNPGGVNAEFIAVPESAAVLPKPERLTHAEAAALPFGAITSVTFLREMAKIQPGERVLIAGASGGVGVYAVQVAKHLGAEVTAICSPGNAELVRSLGADHVIDYTTEDPRQMGRTWDVIVDPVGKMSFADYRDLAVHHHAVDARANRAVGRGDRQPRGAAEGLRAGGGRRDSTGDRTPLPHDRGRRGTPRGRGAPTQGCGDPRLARGTRHRAADPATPGRLASIVDRHDHAVDRFAN